MKSPGDDKKNSVLHKTLRIATKGIPDHGDETPAPVQKRFDKIRAAAYKKVYGKRASEAIKPAPPKVDMRDRLESRNGPKVVSAPISEKKVNRTHRPKEIDRVRKDTFVVRKERMK